MTVKDISERVLALFIALAMYYVVFKLGGN